MYLMYLQLPPWEVTGILANGVTYKGRSKLNNNELVLITGCMTNPNNAHIVGWKSLKITSTFLFLCVCYLPKRTMAFFKWSFTDFKLEIPNFPTIHLTTLHRETPSILSFASYFFSPPIIKSLRVNVNDTSSPVENPYRKTYDSSTKQLEKGMMGCRYFWRPRFFEKKSTATSSKRTGNHMVTAKKLGQGLNHLNK